MEVYQHVLYFEAKDLTDRERDKIRRHFERRRDSGGGECGAVERAGINSYAIGFRQIEDLERVLQRKLHRILLPDGEIQLIVRRTLACTQPSDSVTPQTPTVSTKNEVLERRIQVDPFLLKYLLDCPNAFKILQKKLLAVECSGLIDFIEKKAVIRKNIQRNTGEFVADAETWTVQVDKVFHGLIENYICYHVVEPRMVKLLSQDTSIVRDDVKVYFEARDVVLVGETEAVKEKVAHLKKSLPALVKVHILDHQFKVVEEQLGRDMRVRCPGIQITRCLDSVVFEGDDKDVESGAKLLQGMIARIKVRRLQVSESLWDFLVFSGAVIKYQTLFLTNLSSPVSIEAEKSILLSSLSPAAIDEAEAILKREVSDATITVQGTAAEPANVERLKDILGEAEDLANTSDLRVMVNFNPAFGSLTVKLAGYSANVRNLQDIARDFQRTKVHAQEEVKLPHSEMVECFSDIFVLTGLDKSNLTLKASGYPYPHALLSGPCHQVKETKEALTLSLANFTFDTLVFDGPAAQQYFNNAGKESKTLVETSCRVLITAQETACPEAYPQKSRSINFSNFGAGVFSFGLSSSHTDTWESLKVTKPSLQVKLGSIVDEQVNVMVIPMNNRTLTSTKIGQCLLSKAGQIIKSKFDLMAARCGSTAGSVIQIDAPGSLQCSKIFFIECAQWDGPGGNSVKGLALGLKSCLDLCAQLGFSSVSFPLIGPGVLLQYPKEEAIKVLANAISDFDSQSTFNSLSTIRIVLSADYPDSDESYQSVYRHFSAKMGLWSGTRSIIGDLDDIGFSVRGAPSSIPTVHTVQPQLPTHNDLSSLWSGSQSKTSTFFFFGLSRDSVDNAKLKLKSLHETHCCRQRFQKSELEFLTKEETEELREVAKSSGLHFELDPTGHDVVVNGLKDSVGKVMQMINVSLRRKVTVKEESDLYDKVAWCILGEDGNWERLPQTANHRLENNDITEGIEDAQGNTLVVDRNKTKAQRGFLLSAKLKRLEILPDLTPPLYWDNMEAGKNLVKVVLDQFSAEYRKVAAVFRQTCLKNIQTITRVQNIHLRRAYEVQKKRISEKNGNAGEKHLYHGTTADSCLAIIKNGFDRRYAGQNGTSYGHGCYFAANASYSSTYAKVNAEGSRFMLVARVLTGIHRVGNSTMKAPPPRDPQRPNDLYDSLVDQQIQPNLFVVFHDNQAYPDYLIKF